MKLTTVKANKILVSLFSLLFSVKTWKYIFIIISLLGLFTSYKLARKMYVVRCSAGGMFMTQQKCDDFAQGAFYTAEYYRLSSLEQNQQYEIPDYDN